MRFLRFLQKKMYYCDLCFGLISNNNHKHINNEYVQVILLDYLTKLAILKINNTNTVTCRNVCFNIL